ncbi:UDP-N-acetylmuramate dehydrogenase [Lysobacter sp. A6]|uniref:UDP-N-acetylenolpyruvoylglucosamine reductase n=1 Tax=Noviluteimonas lactosilytica TaxID=2888523 RepID=A0ABS8JJC5_9GAMM|nr:UDP-N-acetylmuramate dehydrogenase [Lysobacter lactosilyticus]MCC8363568.1 UDP-N-acetylmuramate dehydrogenase [Lysobacter lactosilyticus]
MSTIEMGKYRLVENAKLDARNTFGVAARAPMLVEVADTDALPDLFGNAMLRDGPVLVLGGGSNLLFAGDAPGAVLALTAQKIALLEDDGDIAIVRADAGVEWHAFVLWTLGHGLAGLENLALIPGTVGAAPIQNIGAYGVEVRESIHAVHAFDRDTRSMTSLTAAQCAFAYRDSVFKHAPDRYVVTAVDFRLSRTPHLRTDYAGVGDELAAMGIDAPRPSQVAEAVCRIRRRKLPDPAVIGNAGSFFKNPIVPAAEAEALQREHAALPMFRSGNEATRKLSAAWLIDQCGWKGHREGDAGVAATHALVLVNHGHATGAELLALARRIAASVRERFGVAIEPEPRIVGDRW